MATTAAAFGAGQPQSAFGASQEAQTVSTPTDSPGAGSYGSTQSVTLSCATAGASIYYTTDGSTPTGSSTLYSGAISVSTTTTIKAIAILSGWDNSSILTSAYTISGGSPQNASPVFITRSSSSYSPNRTPGAINCAPTAASRTSSSLAPGRTPGAINCSPLLASSPASSLTPGRTTQTNVAPLFISRSSASYAPSATAGAVNASVGLAARNNSSYQPDRTPGSVNASAAISSRNGVALQADAQVAGTPAYPNFAASMAYSYDVGRSPGSVNATVSSNERVGAAYSGGRTPGAVSIISSIASRLSNALVAGRTAGVASASALCASRSSDAPVPSLTSIVNAYVLSNTRTPLSIEASRTAGSVSASPSMVSSTHSAYIASRIQGAASARPDFIERNAASYLVDRTAITSILSNIASRSSIAVSASWNTIISTNSAKASSASAAMVALPYSIAYASSSLVASVRSAGSPSYTVGPTSTYPAIATGNTTAFIVTAEQGGISCFSDLASRSSLANMAGFFYVIVPSPQPQSRYKLLRLLNGEPPVLGHYKEEEVLVSDYVDIDTGLLEQPVATRGSRIPIYRYVPATRSYEQVDTRLVYQDINTGLLEQPIRESRGPRTNLLERLRNGLPV